MSYQVLARKWRPRTFAELVGQEHVLKALVNALNNDRLHHAYLFTGTRGVGKTTIARILAKSLNCEQGISAKPCGMCSACVEISEGRFVDLIEVDAASRTKVEDTRELLENVQYRPTRGRYKVYLIDEVHMLSGHSFNALLKTLEEPPPHVKFLLATTDPQKLPVTILSRCLQFNLKHLSVERISGHLHNVLTAENVPFEEPALLSLARAADGSMRDALSLTDQAIAHGGGQVADAEVTSMLGTIDRQEIQALCRALAARDAAAVLAATARMAEFSPDYGQALGELLAIWHRVAVAQQVPEAIDDSLGDQELVRRLAAEVAPEDVQLFYQIGLLGRRDLPYAADPRSGFEMVLLRQLAFQPEGVTPPAGPPPERQRDASPVDTAVPASIAASETTGETALGRSSAPAAEKVEVPETKPGSEALEQPAAAAMEAPSSESGEQGFSSKQNSSDQQGVSDQPRFSSEQDSGPQDFAGQRDYSSEDSYFATADDYFNSPPVIPPSEAPKRQNTNESVADASVRPVDSAHKGSATRTRPESRSVPDAAVDTPDRSGFASAPAQSRLEESASAEPVVEKTGKGAQLKAVAPVETPADSDPGESSGDPWLDLYPQLQLGGILYNTASNLALVAQEGNSWHFIIDGQQSALFETEHQQRLAEVLTQHLGSVQRVVITAGELPTETPARRASRIREERRLNAVATLQQDPLVAELLARFSGRLLEQTVVPRGT